MEVSTFQISSFGSQGFQVSTFSPSDSGETSTVSLTFPASEVWPLDLFHARRGLVGGRLARCWFSFDSGGTTYVVHFGQGPAGTAPAGNSISFADPTQFVAALSGATPIYVNLGTADRSPGDVADLVGQALDAEGFSFSVDGSAVAIQNATNLVIPASVDMTNTDLRGMFGGQRDDFGDGGDGTVLNQNGGNNGTGSIHIGTPGQALARGGRTLGVYCFATNGMQPRLAASIGPDYPGEISPGSLTILGQGISTAPHLAMPYGGAFGGALFEAAAFEETEHLWGHYRDDDGGGIRYRLHGQTPVGRGDLGLDQQLLWDTDVPRDNTDAFGSTYTPNLVGTYEIYIPIGVLFELPDDNGNYYANGSLDLRIGDQNNDRLHGTQYLVDPSIIDGETTHQRYLLPNFPDGEIVSVSRTVRDIVPDVEDSNAVFYQWTDTDHPSTTPATVLGGIPGTYLGRMVLRENIATTKYLVTALSVANLGEGYLSVGFNYVTSTGAPLTTYTLPVFLDVGASSSWLNCWVDNRGTWHDNIRGAAGGRALNAGVQEYRTRFAAGNTGMPVDEFGETWPDPMNTDASDDSPAAIALDWYIIRRTGMVAN